MRDLPQANGDLRGYAATLYSDESVTLQQPSHYKQLQLTF